MGQTRPDMGQTRPDMGQTRHDMGQTRPDRGQIALLKMLNGINCNSQMAYFYGIECCEL